MSLHSALNEFERLKRVLDIVSHDYRPEQFPPVTGYFLASGQDVRLVVGSGNHRVSALVAMGVDTVEIALHSHTAVVNAASLHLWSIREGGIFEPECALALHSRMLKG